MSLWTHFCLFYIPYFIHIALVQLLWGSSGCQRRRVDNQSVLHVYDCLFINKAVTRLWITLTRKMSSSVCHAPLPARMEAFTTRICLRAVDQYERLLQTHFNKVCNREQDMFLFSLLSLCHFIHIRLPQTRSTFFLSLIFMLCHDGTCFFKICTFFFDPKIDVCILVFKILPGQCLNNWAKLTKNYC